jgi:contact-dependent growth inhibition (CDI) system CdiI-like immunity protein
MKSKERLPFAQWAEIHRTDRFISVEPLSGYSMVQREDDAYVIYLAPNAADDALGRALLEALGRSRFIWPRDEREFFEWPRYMRCYRNWQKDFMRRYGYKTKRDAYRNMDWCRVERSEGKISIQPHKRDKPEYWTDLPADRTVVIPATTDAAAAGAALRLALDRCE